MQRLRFPLGVLALAAFLSAMSVAMAPFAQAARPHGKTRNSQRTGHSHHHHAHTAVRCARKSSFRARGGGHIRRKHHPAGCAKHGSSKHRAAAHSKAHRAKRHRSGSANPAHAGDTCPGAGLQPTQGNIETVRTATLCLVNEERTSRGEAPLQQNGHLQQSAQAHTESMAFGDYFEHDGPDGTPLSRMIAAGYIPNSQVGYEVGENIGWGTLSLGTPRAIVAAWMASPGHRANILDIHFRDTAVGVSPHVPSSLGGGQTGGVYTQDFGVIVTG